MRILHVTRQFYPSIGGVENVVGHLAKQAQSTGHQVGVVALNRLFDEGKRRLVSAEVVDGIEVRRVPYLGPRRYAIAPGVLRYVSKYDIIHLHSSDFFLDYLALTEPIHKKPIIFHTHGVFFHTQFARRVKLFYFHTVTRMATTQISAIICDSEQDFTLMQDIAPSEKLHMIPNGVDYEHLASFDIHNRDPNLLISVGRLASNKRFDRLLRAFAVVTKERPWVKLVIIGPDWGELAALQALSAQLAIAEQVKLAGEVSEEELLAYLKRASVWMTASAYESFGIALLEAMAAGCISIAQPLTAFKQFIVEQNEGLYADFDQPEQSAKVILKALELSSQEREQIIVNARKRAAQFSWNVIEKRVEEIYSRVMV